MLCRPIELILRSWMQHWIDEISSPCSLQDWREFALEFLPLHLPTSQKTVWFPDWSLATTEWLSAVDLPLASEASSHHAQGCSLSVVAEKGLHQTSAIMISTNATAYVVNPREETREAYIRLSWRIIWTNWIQEATETLKELDGNNPYVLEAICVCAGGHLHFITVFELSQLIFKLRVVE
jgi:hypothetical protein